MGKKVDSESDSNKNTSQSQKNKIQQCSLQNNTTSKVSTRFQSKALTCGICYSDIQEQGKLDCCQHEFCFDCIGQWSKNENTCPHCKRRFSNIQKKWLRINYSQKINKVIQKEQNQIVKVQHRNQGQFTQQQQRAYNEHLNNILIIIQSYFMNNREVRQNLINGVTQSVSVEVQINQRGNSQIVPVEIRASQIQVSIQQQQLQQQQVNTSNITQQQQEQILSSTVNTIQQSQQ